MAEALGKHLFGDKVYFDSVGVRHGEVDGFAVAVMEEIGLDITGHNAKSFDDLQDTSFDLVVSMTPQAQHAALELTRTLSVEVEYWPTYDPTATRGTREDILESYRKTRDLLHARILERFQGT